MRLADFFLRRKKERERKRRQLQKVFLLDLLLFCSVVLPFSRPSYSSLAHRGSPLISKKKIALALAHKVGRERERERGNGSLFTLALFCVGKRVSCQFPLFFPFSSQARLKDKGEEACRGEQGQKKKARKNHQMSPEALISHSLIIEKVFKVFGDFVPEGRGGRRGNCKGKEENRLQNSRSISARWIQTTKRKSI